MFWAFLVGAYLVGSFPTGVVLTRRRYGIDVREMGSGNIGATNVTRVFGWSAGLLTLIVDLMKGALAVAGVDLLGGQPEWAPWCGVAAVVGHCFSVFLKFRGGKGVATSLGVVLMLAPWAGLVGAGVYAVLLGLTKISAVGSLGGLLTVVVCLFIADVSPSYRLAVVIIALIVILKHRSNIVRLLKS